MSNQKARERIEDVTFRFLSGFDEGVISRALISDTVRQFASMPVPGTASSLREDDIERIVKSIEARFEITMELGTLLEAEDFKPWLDAQRPNITWYYWNRYLRYLADSGFPPNVLATTDVVTDQILEHLENPLKSGSWARKGMVVGHVQSGKTANYTGVINKAADSGYRVIILLAGSLNALRNQTQERIDSGFIGVDTGTKIPIGVGIYSTEKTPICFTTKDGDFSKRVATQIGVGIAGLMDPVILVIKKNKSTLDNLIDWLKNNNRHKLQDNSMLLIDDEADYASINTRGDSGDVTAINERIRRLLSLFDRSSYLGYTATPFANIFIDPDTDHEMLGEDLFPQDFIINLDPPSNYFGPEGIFADEPIFDVVRSVTDYEENLPHKHKSAWRPEALPLSLKIAIRGFILIRAQRILRDQSESHNSMLINVSRFTAVQSAVRVLVHAYVNELRDAISNYSSLPSEHALMNPIIAALHETWLDEFQNTGHTWADIQPILKTAVSVGVIEVNISSQAAKLDYSQKNYPEGRHVIAVGGLSLSRGLTLEGLTVSYFVRNSIMYDTLMQMGRWFGYRDGYGDLCRIYMPPEAISWYSHISEATEELRGEFRRMQAAGMSPKDFGLKVRSHPDSLIVTARNKMRTANHVIRQIDLAGRLVETTVLFTTNPSKTNNFNAIEEMVQAATQNGEYEVNTRGHLWKNVPNTDVINFVQSFENHPGSPLTEQGPLLEYIRYLQLPWDVVLVTVTDKDGIRKKVRLKGWDAPIALQERTAAESLRSGVVMRNRRLASRGLEQVGLTAEQLARVNDESKGKNIPDRAYREKRSNPLLMLHILHIKSPDIVGVPGFGMSFPVRDANAKPYTKLVGYDVNLTFWHSEYMDTVDDEIGDDE